MSTKHSELGSTKMWSPEYESSGVSSAILVFQVSSRSPVFCETSLLVEDLSTLFWDPILAASKHRMFSGC